MSIQHTAESALQAIEELYNAIDLSSQQQSPISINDSENLIHALCNLSQLIEHINQTGMCGHTPRVMRNFDSNRSDRKKIKNFINPHWNNYDENIMMDSAVIGPSPQPGQLYGECVLYHPIRIITTCAEGPTVLHENDFMRKEGQYRKGYDHNKRFTHYNHTKKNGRRMSRNHGRRSKIISRASRTSRSGSRESRMSRQSRRSSRGSRARSSRSSRTSRSSRNGRKSRRSSERGSRRSRSSQRRSRSHRRSSHKHRSTDQQNQKYYAHQIPSRPVSTTTNPTAPSYPSNQIASTPIGTQPSTQQSYIRSMPSPAPISTASNSPLLPPPPPTISALYHPHPSSQIPMQQHHQSSLSPIYRSITNPLNDQSPSYQQVPISTTSRGNITLSQQQQSSSLSSANPLLNIPTQNGISPSDMSPIQTTNSTFTSSSNNCPECRAITRLLQWAPLKCYDAAGIRRGIFLAGPKSEQLLKALYSSMKDSSLSLDDIEDCLCDTE